MAYFNVKMEPVNVCSNKAIYMIEILMKEKDKTNIEKI